MVLFALFWDSLGSASNVETREGFRLNVTTREIVLEAWAGCNLMLAVGCGLGSGGGGGRIVGQQDVGILCLGYDSGEFC